MNLKPVLPLLLFSVTALAQVQTDSAQSYKKNSIYAELGGNAIIYSLNFDHKFAEHVSWRIGLRVLPGGGGNAGNTFLLLPTMINFLPGSHKKKRFELGLGFLHGVHDSGYFLRFTTTIGYRYQPPEGGFNFRIGLTPQISGYGIFPWAGISFGYGF